MAFATVVLAVPFVAMQLTDTVHWTPFDFIVAAGLLYGTGLACELVLRTVTSTRYRIAICVGILALLAVVWMEMAVGIFESPIAGS